VLLSLWHVHMERRGVNRVVSLAALAILAWQLHSEPASFHDLEALGGGLFVYLVVWVLTTYDRQPGLQAVATAALLLSAGVLAKPPIALSCVTLSLAFFLAHLRSTAHPVGFGPLLFTPAILCALGATTFAFLNGGTLLASSIDTRSLAGTVGSDRAWRSLLLFPLTVIAFRTIRRRFRSPDLAFLAMYSLGAVICRARWVNGALSLEDLFFLAAGGAAALVSASPEAPHCPSGAALPRH
jgi:hypothetical protein